MTVSRRRLISTCGVHRQTAASFLLRHPLSHQVIGHYPSMFQSWPLSPWPAFSSQIQSL